MRVRLAACGLALATFALAHVSLGTETEMCMAYIDYSVPRNASDLVRKQRAMWNGPLAPGVAVSSAVGPTPPAAGYRFPHT